MDAQSLIELYRIGFFVSAAVAVLGFAWAVFSFFRFRIGDIWAIRTGRAQRKAVQIFQEASRNDGRMRQDENKGQMSMEESSGAQAETTDSLGMTAKKAEQSSPVQTVQATDILPMQKQQFQEETYGTTSDLGFGETDDLCYGGTTVLQSEGMNQTTVLGQPGVVLQNFVITQEVILIHTMEKILS